MLFPEAAHSLLLLCQGYLHPAGEYAGVRLGAPPDPRPACSFEHRRVASGDLHPPKGSRGSCPGLPSPVLLTSTLGHLEGL